MTPIFRLTSPACLLLLAAALALRLAYFAVSYSQLGPDGLWSAVYDTQNYASAAHDLLEGTDVAGPYLLMWGPGYPLFLAPFLAFCERPVLPLLLVQILLSSVSCVIVARLGHLLVRSRSVGLLAGWLLATSYTSVTLASAALPDTLFFFLGALGFYLLLTGLHSNRVARGAAAAAILTAGALTKPIGAFWSLLVIAVAAPTLWRSWRHGPALKRGLFQAAVCVVILGSAQALWMLRNYRAFGIASVSSTVQGGLANIAAFALEGAQGQGYRDIREGWHQDYRRAQGLETLTPGQMHAADGIGIRRVLRDHPAALAWACVRLAAENMVAPNELARVHFPESQGRTIALERTIQRLRLGTVWVVLSVAGVILLWAAGDYAAGWILSSLYFYYAVLVSATRWQGSRLFHPAELAATVLSAVTLVTVFGWWQRKVTRRLAPDRLAQ